jgi:hypothetical protein
MVKLVIDGIEIEAEPEATILETAEKADIEIPTLCHYTGLYQEATCRMCIVELVTKGKPGRIVSSCAFPVSEGLVVETNNERVRKDRRLALELILATHKIKCQSCPRKGGNCELLDLCKEYGVEGIPVCSECPLHGDDCLLAKGDACLGPLTVAGSGGVCMFEGRLCEGCRGPVTRPDVVKEALRLYDVHGISVDEVRRKLTKYYSSSPDYDRLIKTIGEVSTWK